MITIGKNKMKELLIKLMDLGLTNEEIAVRLNEDYGATDDNRLTVQQVAKYKALVGLKGYKPKKKQLFELVDDDVQPDLTAPEFEEDVEFNDAAAESLLQEKYLEDEFLTNPETRYKIGIDPYDENK